MPKGSEYGPNYRAAMAGAELQWEALSKSMREQMRRSMFSGSGPRGAWLHYPPLGTARALARRNLVRRIGHSFWLTPMGLLVREAGHALEARRG